LWGPVHRSRIIGKAWFIYWPPAFAISDIPIAGSALTNLFARLGIHFSYTPSPHWGIVPTFADPLQSSSGTPAPDTAEHTPPSSNNTPTATPEPYPSPMLETAPLPTVPPNAYPSPSP